MDTNNDNNEQRINNYCEPENINYDFDTYPSYYCPLCNNYRTYNEPIVDDYEYQDDYEYLDIDADSQYRQGGYGRPRRRRRRRRRNQFPFVIFPFFFPFDGFDDDWDEY